MPPHNAPQHHPPPTREPAQNKTHNEAMDRDAQFQELRPLLFSLAYRMLGSRADAEDIVQEAWLRWRSAAAAEIRSPKAFLTTVVARLSLDALKAAHRNRESYVGPWLPEPLVGSFTEPPGTQPIEMAELLSVAFLHVLESLSPAERVAFLLREAFDAGYDEIAATLDTSEANSRQLVVRARKHLESRRARFPVDRGRHQKMLEQFLAACASGDPAPFTGLLAEDVILYSDGGGKRAAALNPIYGADRVARFLLGVARKTGAEYRVQFADVNGEPGAILTARDGARTVIAIELNGDGRLSRVFLIVNPDKTRVH
jgi:RNA polymerase sigma-70 factor, ECF subfamily